jgi:hypothetical protein
MVIAQLPIKMTQWVTINRHSDCRFYIRAVWENYHVPKALYAIVYLKLSKHLPDYCFFFGTLKKKFLTVILQKEWRG